MSLSQMLLDDGSGLELSLSLSPLSSSDSRHRRHGFTAAAPPPPSADLEPAPFPTLSAHPSPKHASFPGTFLDEQNEMVLFPRVSSGSSLYSFQKDRSPVSAASPQHPPDLPRSPFVFNQIPGLSREHPPPSHTAPLLVDAFKLGPHAAFDTVHDSPQEGNLEQSNGSYEARPQRDSPVEEQQKSQKKRKRDGRSETVPGNDTAKRETVRPGLEIDDDDGDHHDRGGAGGTSRTDAAENHLVPQLQDQNTSTRTFNPAVDNRCSGKMLRSLNTDTFLSAFGSSQEDVRKNVAPLSQEKGREIIGSSSFMQKLPMVENVVVGSGCVDRGKNNREKAFIAPFEIAGKEEVPSAGIAHPAHSVALGSYLPFAADSPYAMPHLPLLASGDQMRDVTLVTRPERSPPLEGRPWLQITGPDTAGRDGTRETRNDAQLVSPTADGSQQGIYSLHGTSHRNSRQNPSNVIPRMHQTSTLSRITEPGLLPFVTKQTQQDQAYAITFSGFAPSTGVQDPQRSPSTGIKEDAHSIREDAPQMCYYNAETTNTAPVGGQSHQRMTDNPFIIGGFGDELANIQGGIAPGLKFGGTGTAPDLPWVHTTGPNGHTINGVLYRLCTNQLKIVCACHGKHMSPSEFAMHGTNASIMSAGDFRASKYSKNT